MFLKVSQAIVRYTRWDEVTLAKSTDLRQEVVLKTNLALHRFVILTTSRCSDKSAID